MQIKRLSVSELTQHTLWNIVRQHGIDGLMRVYRDGDPQRNVYCLAECRVLQQTSDNVEHLQSTLLSQSLAPWPRNELDPSSAHCGV